MSLLLTWLVLFAPTLRILERHPKTQISVFFVVEQTKHQPWHGAWPMEKQVWIHSAVLKIDRTSDGVTPFEKLLPHIYKLVYTTVLMEIARIIPSLSLFSPRTVLGVSSFCCDTFAPLLMVVVAVSVAVAVALMPTTGGRGRCYRAWGSFHRSPGGRSHHPGHQPGKEALLLLLLILMVVLVPVVLVLVPLLLYVLLFLWCCCWWCCCSCWCFCCRFWLWSCCSCCYRICNRSWAWGVSRTTLRRDVFLCHNLKMQRNAARNKSHP